MLPTWQTFGDTACHPFAALKGKLREGEGSGSPDAEILRCAQDDSQDTTQVMSRLRAGAAALSPSLPLRCAQGVGSLKGELLECEGPLTGSLISKRLPTWGIPCDYLRFHAKMVQSTDQHML